MQTGLDWGGRLKAFMEMRWYARVSAAELEQSIRDLGVGSELMQARLRGSLTSDDRMIRGSFPLRVSGLQGNIFGCGLSREERGMGYLGYYRVKILSL